MKSGRRKCEKVLLFVVLFETLAVLSVVSIGCASATTRYVNPGDSIQDVVNYADPGDIIIVRDGIYTENVNVSKSLTIRSENGSASTIVQATNVSKHVFKMSADSANIGGFTVTGATGDGKAGIYLDDVDHCNISHNNASNNHHGIKLDSANNNTISNNNVSFNTNHGLRLEGSTYNNVTSNTLFSNNNQGILMENSNNNP